MSPTPVYRVYQYRGGFVHENDRRIEAVQVIHASSLAQAAAMFGTTVHDLRQHGGLIDPARLTKGRLTLKDAAEAWDEDVEAFITANANTLIWHPIDERPVLWRIGVDGSGPLPPRSDTP